MEHSIWSGYLRNENDECELFKSVIKNELDTAIAKVTSLLLKSEHSYTNDVAKKMAVNLVMEQLLCIQNEVAPVSQRDMIINLFTEHPDVSDFRNELCETIKNYK